MTISFKPIITSLIDSDLYKETMRQPMLHCMAQNQAVYRFKCRNKPEFPLAELVDEVNEQLDWLCTLRYTEPELSFIGGLRFIKPDYVDFLRLFQYQRRYITASAKGDELQVETTGSQVHSMGFEIPVLAIINELYFRRLMAIHGGEDIFLGEGRKRLQDKIELLLTAEAEGKLSGPNQQGFEFFDFGLRRRLSGAWHEEVVTTLAREVPQFFKGTSSMYLAKKLGLVPIGTMAHEFMQTFQAMPGVQLRYFQQRALETWVQEYRGDLGIALTDTAGMDAFLADFDPYFAKLFDGLRHDSGNPVLWGEKALAHYAKLKVDARAKRLVFSDGLNVPRAIELYQHFTHRVLTGFGIGTNLTNDIGLEPLQIVMKLMTCNGQATAKLPDSAGKTHCDDAVFLTYMRQVFNRQD